ncbi:hypothetical protein V3C99_007187 [Haemonchus contortus]
MSSSSEAKETLKPILDTYIEALDEGQVDKAVAFYLPEAVLIHRGKGCTYGREAIKQELQKFDGEVGKTTMKMTNEKYQNTTDYIILEADYELTTEKKGTIKGTFTQIWKKTSSGYMIWHDEFDVN